MDLSLNVRRDDGGATTVSVGGEVDLGSGRQLYEYAAGIMSEHGPSLTIDLAGVTFLDCGGLSVLQAIRARALLRGGQVRLGSTSAPVRRVLDIIGMDSTLAASEPSHVDDARQRIGVAG